MIKIAVDCMGSDNGPSIVCEAILNFLKNNEEVFIYACGNEEDLITLKNNDRIEIVPSTEVVPMECGAMQVMRMKDSSMMKVFNIYKEKEVDAAVNAGIKTVTLGKRILRTETAASAVLPIIMYENNEM